MTFSPERKEEAKAYFCRQCLHMGYDHAEAEKILEAYIETRIAIQVGPVYVLVDDRYWERAWLDTGLTFQEKVDPETLTIPDFSSLFK